jgi:hypothetical protein
MMRGILAGLMAAWLGLTGAGAGAQPQADIAQYPNCKYCGMDREKFAHSRMLIDYGDGSGLGSCSLHCAAVDLALNLDKSPKSIQVADYRGKNLVDAQKAAWVMGGDLPGVMTKRAKWAFADPRAARTFVREHGGQLVKFEDAIKAAYEDMYADTKMIREKRAKMKMMEQQKKP